MQTQIKKWGNSLALRIPKSMADQLAIKTDTQDEIPLVRGQLIIKLIPELKLTLTELLEGINEDNVHHEIEVGAAVGKEVW